MNSQQIIIGLDNPKDPTNVGSVLRAAGNFGVEKVIYTGTRYARALKCGPRVPKSRRRVGGQVVIEQVADLLVGRTPGQAIVCVELAVNATPLPSFVHPPSALYLFGAEDGTLSQTMIDQADHVVYVPTAGCMNLAASVSVVLYDRLQKTFTGSDNKSILENRDRNNNVIAKASGQEAT